LDVDLGLTQPLCDGAVAAQSGSEMPVSRPVSTGGCDPAEIEALASRRALKRLAGRPSGVVDWWGGCGVMWSPPALLVRPSTRFLPPFSIAICPPVALNAGFWWSPRTSSCLSGPSKLVLVVVGLGHALVWFAVGVDGCGAVCGAVLSQAGLGGESAGSGLKLAAELDRGGGGGGGGGGGAVVSVPMPVRRLLGARAGALGAWGSG
jgi:hypothetical protein